MKDVYERVKVLVQLKGMDVEDAIREVDAPMPVYAKLPEIIKTKIREEAYTWSR